MHKSFDSNAEFNADSKFESVMHERKGKQIVVEPTTIVTAAARRAADHEFGSQATDFKLSLVEAYSRAFTTALRGKFAQLWYIDAFAGTGERTERVPATHFMGTLVTPEKVIRHRGSARIAIEIQPAFDKLVFVEKKPRAVRALHELREQHLGRDIEVIAGDANREIPKLIQPVNWRQIRAVMFLDPYGMTVDWKTLESIAKTGAIDV